MGCGCGPLDGPGVIASLEANPLGSVPRVTVEHDGVTRVVAISDVAHVITSRQYEYDDVPGHPGWKEARPVPSDKQTRIDIRIGGRLVYSQDVDEYTLEHSKSGVQLVGTIGGPNLLTLPDNPLLPPTGTPVELPEGFVPIPDESTAPDAHLNEQPESVPVIETVHTGARDVAAEEEQRKADRAARRKAQADKAPGYGEAATGAAQGDTDSDS